MSSPENSRVGYIVKRYPRYSETFIVNEILQHEEARLPIEIFALRPVLETHFQDVLAAVRAPVTYIPDKVSKAASLWESINAARRELPDFWAALDELGDLEAEDLIQAIDLALRARERGVTHFHAHFGTVSATVARLAARFARIPYTLTLHAKDIYHVSVDPALMRKKLGAAARVITVSDYNQRYLAATYDSAAAKVVRLYNGLNLARFAFTIPSRTSREILAVGRLVEKKGFDVLIDACAILRDRGVAFQCRIVGDGTERATLSARIAHLNLGAMVRLAGPQPHAELIGTFREAAVVAAPCVIGADGDRDGLPTVLLEAMALGVPCVATDVTGIPELVRDGDTGLCVPQRDPQALADALQRLLDDADLRVDLATRARRLIEQDFDIRRNAAQLREWFAVAARDAAAGRREET
ncbi:MAG: colanic acid biosynthesis glycosyltransferase WcaL [Candidatus Competibacteraceae bacterium]|nr:MAG: colanic acid biosynthesis glycosyltransferase WcaL [Candidatus Competibacteraceae bacterium]